MPTPTLADFAVRNIRDLVTCAGAAAPGDQQVDLAVQSHSAIAAKDGTIVWIGSDHLFEEQVSAEETLDAKEAVALPGFIDPHTHTVFAGSRDEEFAQRVAGLSYQEIAARGGGILTTMEATRQASFEELFESGRARVTRMLTLGTTTCEIKSGYGLSREAELKQLRVIQALREESEMDIVPTFLGAHALPPEYQRNRSGYLKLLTEELLPEIAEEGLAEYCDVFCETGAFSEEESIEILTAGKELGLKAKVHADELADSGGSRVALEVGATSADHLVYTPRQRIQGLAKKGIGCVLLPGTTFFLMSERSAPAQAFTDEGATVALATDFNPGSAMCENMQMALVLGVLSLKLSIEEAFRAVTIGAAYAIDRHEEVGSLEVGKKMDLQLYDVPHYRHLVYHWGVNHLVAVIKAGRIAYRAEK